MSIQYLKVKSFFQALNKIHDKMKTHFYNIIISLLFLFIGQGELFAGDIIISGKISPANMDTMQLTFKREFIYNNIGVENYAAICDRNGYFIFKIKNVRHPAKIMLIGRKSSALLVDHYVEEDDSVFISFVKIGNKYIKTFSGKGFAKFYSREALDEASLRFTDNIQNVNYSKDPVVNKVAAFILRTERLRDTLLQVLAKHKNKVSGMMYSIFQSDIIGRGGYQIMLVMNARLLNATPLQKNQLHSLFKDFFLMPANTFKGSVYSDDYIQFLSMKWRIHFELVYGRKYSMHECYSDIVKSYKGEMRERMITYYLVGGGKSGVSNREYESCLADALKIISRPIYKEYLQNQLYSMQKGKELYNFSLTDTSGRSYTPADFRGKVVLLDFWFTGCFACIKLAEELEKYVIGKFIDSPVVFISVGVDTDKDKWLCGVRSGKYSGSRSVNLFAGGPDLSHPFVKYYNISGFPRLMLIDAAGNMYEANPSRNADELIASIWEAFQKSRQ